MVRAVASAAFDFSFRYLPLCTGRFYDRYRLTYGDGPRETVARGRSGIERSRNRESFVEISCKASLTWSPKLFQRRRENPTAENFSTRSSDTGVLSRTR